MTVSHICVCLRKSGLLKHCDFSPLLQQPIENTFILQSHSNIKQLKYNSGVIQYLTISGLLTPFLPTPKGHGNLQWKLTMQIDNRDKKVGT
jgi:hypothetical protein